MITKNINMNAFSQSEGIRFNPGSKEHAFNVPWRDDKIASGSFNSEKNIWYDHGTGESGDIIDFIARKYRISRKAARKYLRITYKKHTKLQLKSKQTKSLQVSNADSWQVMNPVPIEAEDYPLPSNVYQNLSRVGEYYYRDTYGRLRGIVCRWEKPSGEKIIRPFAFCRNTQTGEKGWRMKDFPKPYPIYGIENYHKTKCPVLIVEGEKCVHEARAIVGDVFLVITWHGGAKRVKDTDWSPLRDNRRKILFPDNDIEGAKAMLEIVRIVENGNS